MILDAFAKTYSERTYLFTTMVSHKGVLLAFAMDSERRIYYSVLNLKSGNGDSSQGGEEPASPFDKDAWPEGPSELIFPNEIAEVGYGVADQTALPVYRKGSNKAEKPDTPLPDPENPAPPFKADYFLSTTARLSAPYPFQVISDGQFVIVFRQAVAANDPNNLNIGDPGAKDVEIIESDGKPVALVDNTLLVDRFVLVGTALKRNMEVRFQRSRSRTRPQSRKDSLGAKDMDGNPFFEPTHELKFIGQLKEGHFAALTLPTQVAEIKRWQIFTQNSRTGMIDSFNIEVAADGLFNTRGSQIFTCIDHPEVYSNKAGTCVEPSLLNPAVTCDKPLVLRLVTSGFAESALKLGSGDFVQLQRGGPVGPTFTLEAWVYPQGNTDMHPATIIACTAAEGQSGPTLALERQTRLNLSFMDDGKILSYTTKNLVTPGQWNHIAVSYNSIVARFYVNGKLIEKSRAFEKKTTSTGRVMLFGAPEDGFIGLIDDVRVWNRTRTGGEIQDDHHRRLTGLEPGLTGYWRFDEGNGSQVFDETGNGGNGSLRNKAQMVPSDAPLGEDQGINRNSFGIEGRKVVSGLAALLYYQQTELASGYSGDKKRFKRNGRVMLAAATRSIDPDPNDRPYIAVLDFAVSNSGQISQIPDQMQLHPIQPVNPGGKSMNVNDLLNQYADLQLQNRLLDEDINKLDGVLSSLNQALADPGHAQANIQNPAYKGLNKTITTHQKAWNNKQDIEKQVNKYPQTLAAASVTVVGTSYGIGNHKPTSSVTIGWIDFNGPLQATLTCQNLTPVGSQPETYQLGPFTADTQLSGIIILIGIKVEENKQVKQELDDQMKKANQVFEKARQSLIEARDVLKAERASKNQQQGEIKTQLVSLQSFLLSGLSTTMPQVFIDPSGLSLSGGLLSFAWTESAPLLFDSANGNLALYFQGSDNQFFVTYYSTFTDQARYPLETEVGNAGVICVSRTNDLESDKLQIEVSTDPDDPSLCTVRVEGSGIIEIWRKVSRKPQELANTLNGTYANREFLTSGTIELDGGQITALNLTTETRREVKAGKTLIAGNVHLVVQEDTSADKKRISVTGDRLNAPPEVLPVFYLEYDYAGNAETTYLPADLYNGSLLIRALPINSKDTAPNRVIMPVSISSASSNNTDNGNHSNLSLAEGSQRGIVDQKVSSGATLTTKWTAAAPGSTLAFDGQKTVAGFSNLTHLNKTAVEDDLTLEAWVRPTRIDGRARVIQQNSANSTYTLGLEEQPLNSALEFDGSQYIELADGPVLTAPFTQEAWIFPSPQDKGFHGFLGNEPGPDTNQRSPSIWIFEEKKLHAGFGNGQEWLSFITEDVLVLNAWNHIAVTFDGESYRTYVNAVMIHEDNQTFKGQAPVAQPVRWIGRVDNFFQGQMDEVRIWKRARSQGEILADMNRRLGGQETDLIGYWHFDNMQALDYSRYQRSGQLKNNPQQNISPLSAYSVFAGATDLYTQSQAIIPAGSWMHLAATYNQSFGLQFDGKGGYLDCGKEVTLDISTDLTIQIGLKAASTGQMGILSRGRFDDGKTDQNVPYALFLAQGGKVGFAFQNVDQEIFTCYSDGALGTDYTEITVTRKRQQKEPRDPIKDSSGNVIGEKVEAWDLISFFIKGQPSGTIKYEDSTSKKDSDRLRQPVDVGNSNNPLEIGTGFQVNAKKLDGGGSTFLFQAPFTGIISELSIWNKALTSSEIAARRNLRGNEKGLVSWWQFQEGRGKIAYDSKSTNHANLKGSLPWVKDPNPNGSRLSLFLNGESLVSDILDKDALPAGSEQFSLGALKTNSGLDELFQGELEEVRIWQVERTQEQIQDNLFRRLTGEREDLIAYYTFDPTLPNDGLPAITNILGDNSLRGNHLDVTDPDYILSTAPVGEDIPQVRSALAGVRTTFSGLIGGRPAVQEYADMQMDSRGNLTGVLKRCYSYVNSGRWELISGFKIGDLTTEWIGQVQFAPQLKGFIEGAPPVPSENLTTQSEEGNVDGSYNQASSIEVVEAEQTNFTYSASRDSGFDMAVNLKLGGILGAKAEAGFGLVVETVDVENVIGGMAQFEHSQGWLENASTGVGATLTRATSLEMRGRFADKEDSLNPIVGRRFIPDNNGMALVESETADVFALRLVSNGALIAYEMRPNPDIPKDWNLIHFPINPRYSKQGTLDGKIGLTTDPDYPNAKDYSPDISYFKPIEAYGLKNRIQREEVALQVYFDQYDAGAKGRRTADTHFTEKELGAGRLLEKIPHLHKRNIVNTYVWTADGGLFTESQETMDVRQESTGGSYHFQGMAGVFTDLTLAFASAGLKLEADAMFGGHLNLEVQKSQDSSNSFGLNVNLDNVERDIYLRNWDDPDPEIILSNDPQNPQPKKTPGKVDAYRFMSFYLEPKTDYRDLFFSRVVDPIWLEQSDSPAAEALREARQDDKKPACWRVMHRVTYVSRILPTFDDNAPPSLERSLRELDIDSNYELIKQLDPFVSNRLTSFSEFSQAIDDALKDFLPELIPHADHIKQFLSLYYGVGENTITSESDSLVETVRVPNQPPVVNAGQDLVLGLDGQEVSIDLDGSVIDDRLDKPEQIFVTWEKLSGEGEVSFEDRHAIQTRATFTRRGRYILRLTADDGQLTAADEINVVVNEHPVIRTGPALQVTELQANLPGEIVDDGLGDPHSGVLKATWSKKSRTGEVTFTPANTPRTKAIFSTRGHYLLSLTVDNGSFNANADLMVAVAARSTVGLLALYTFEDGQGNVVHDVSGAEQPLDLKIANPASTSWNGGSLDLKAPGLLFTEHPATRINEAIKASNELTVEAWVRPENTEFQGLERLVTISNGAHQRNLILGQNGRRYHASLRTDPVDVNAASQGLAALMPPRNSVNSDESGSGQPDHLVLTRSQDGTARLYLNGDLAGERLVGGDFASWDPSFTLALGNELDGNGAQRAWQGAFHLVALYDRALTPTDVRLHFEFGADTNLPPIISAGKDLTINWPAKKALPIEATLNGRLTHDRPEKETHITWAQVGGPESPNGVEFTNEFALQTDASFVRFGQYRLRLTADDGSLMNSTELSVVVNQPPSVRLDYEPAVALIGDEVDIPVQAVLLASGLGLEVDPAAEPSPFTYTWKQTSGPGSLQISGNGEAKIHLKARERGIYNLEFIVGNGVLSNTLPISLIVNQLPVVNAGPDQSLSLLFNDQLLGKSVTGQLVGAALDTGLGDPNQHLNFRWEQIGGPQPVTFVNPTDPRTKVTFWSNGNYRLALTAANPALDQLQDRAEVNILVNQPPQVDAGPDQIVNLPATADLDGTASDDGLPNPPGQIRHQWTKISGPGEVIFEDSKRDITAATFSTKGVYKLQLNAFDGQDMAADEVEITVNYAPIFNTESLVKTTPGKSVNLQVSIDDDGLGDPASGKTAVQWNPTVTGLEIKKPAALKTEAVAAKRGRYPVDLTVSNGFITTTTRIVVAVFDSPIIKAGDEEIVRLSEMVNLAGKIVDNGLGMNDPALLSLKWDLESGPIKPEFSDPTALAGTVRFPEKGVYVLRLTADNGFFQSSETVRYTVNQEPQIQGPADQEISWNTILAASGQILDDGRGDPMVGKVTTHWSLAAGPDGAEIKMPEALATNIAFKQKGIYTLRLEVSNGFISSQADARIVVNQPPQVQASAEQLVRPETKLDLHGVILDDGLGDPANSKLSFQWTQLSGTKDVKFSNANGQDTQVTLVRTGTYQFEFTANYKELSAKDTIQVEVSGRL